MDIKDGTAPPLKICAASWKHLTNPIDPAADIFVGTSVYHGTLLWIYVADCGGCWVSPLGTVRLLAALLDLCHSGYPETEYYRQTSCPHLEQIVPMLVSYTELSVEIIKLLLLPDE